MSTRLRIASAALAAALAGSVPASPRPGGHAFVNRVGRELRMNGAKFRVAGASNYYLMYKSRFMVDDVLETWRGEPIGAAAGRPAIAGASRSGRHSPAACPLCQLNLDMRQRDIERKFGCEYNLPVFYFTQLLGLAMGCSPSEVSLGSLVVEPRGVLESIGI